jgi:hypothetical protein
MSKSTNDRGPPVVISLYDLTGKFVEAVSFKACDASLL